MQRDNIVIDGAGYILHGAGSGQGISISGRTNVTIKDMQIENFGNGMHA